MPTSIFVTLTDPATGCISDLGSFELRAGKTPEINLSNFQDRLICVNPETGEPLPGETPILLQTGLSASEYGFSWQKDGNNIDFDGPALEVNETGSYSVKVVALSGSDCPATAVATVDMSSAPLFDLRQPGGFGSPTVEVFNIRGYGDYEFSINGESFKPVNGDQIVFQTTSGGEIMVIGRDRNGCGASTKSILLLDFPKFFTPNADGINDRWNIRALSNRPGTEIHIFDRYGKLLASIGPTKPGWDGTYNGKPMPSGEYWFKVKYPDENKGAKTFTGHFSLVR